MENKKTTEEKNYIETTYDRTVEKLSGELSEKTLKTIANIILVVGIIVGFILFILAITSFGETRDSWGRVQQTTGWSQLLLSVYVTLISVTTWAVLGVFVNISNSLKEINKNTKSEKS